MQVSYRENADVHDYLDGLEHVNKSSLLRSLTAAYVRTGDAVEVGYQKRLSDAQTEIRNKRAQVAILESDIEELQREIADLEKKIEERRNSTPEEVVDLAEEVEDGLFPADALEPDNPGIQNRAGKAGLSPRAFVREVERVLEERGGDE